MNKLTGFTLKLLCILFLFLLMPKMAKSDSSIYSSIYIEGVSIHNGEDGIGLSSMRITEFRYSRTNPLGISNLNYFWRVGSNLNFSTIYLSVDKSLTTFIEFSGGVGLSYHLRKGSRLTLTPYFGIFLSDGLLPVNRIDMFSTEFGIEIDLWSRISLMGSYSRSLDAVANTKAFRLGMSLH